jgi:hypothetical protein
MFLALHFRFVSVALVVSAFKLGRLIFLIRECSFHEGFDDISQLLRYSVAYQILRLHFLTVM